jgi:hypothetical protein
MASRRWVITSPPPKTAKCPHCLQPRNKLSVYPTPAGKLCFMRLASSHVAVRAPETVARPAVAVRPAATSATTRPTTCPEPGCGRLPAHKGEHCPTLLRRTKSATVSYAHGG